MVKRFFYLVFKVTIVIFVGYCVLTTDWSSLPNTLQKSLGRDTNSSKDGDGSSSQQVSETGDETPTKNSGLVVHEETKEKYEITITENPNHIVELKVPTDGKELILLVCSLGRGGSSWVGELLSSTSAELMYIFEPLKIIRDVYKAPFTPEIEKEILSMVFLCQFDEVFMDYKRKWDHNFQKLPDTCEGRRCFTPDRVNSRCNKAKTILAKTIRLRLEHVEYLMQDPQFQHLKVIYLSRDPRAQIVSREKVFNQPNTDIMAECAYIESDVKAFHRLSLRYPGHFYFLRYEDMCRRTSEEASDLWRFLRADPNATTPDAWVEYLTAHEKKTKKKSTYFTTFRNSTSQWYMWRRQKSIANEAFLRAIENNCSVAMEHLGYIPLQTVENVKNLSLPFIRDYSCDFWNCWTHRFSRSM